MTTQNAVNDIGTLLKLQNKILNNLTDKLNLCIGSIIHDAIIAQEKAVVINIGIGTLSVDLAEMTTKFMPSKDLKSTIKKAVADGVDPLELELEQLTAEKLMAACNEVI